MMTDMCRILAYVGSELPVQSLLVDPENSLINQALDPEAHPLLQLAGWGFGGWSEHLLRPEEPFRYRRPMAAFYDDNVEGIIPSLSASTLIAHVRAAAYDAGVALVDENCHPFSFRGAPWLVAHNGVLPGWKLLQRELLAHCEDRFLEQMRGTTDTEFLYVLLASLMKGDGDDDVQAAFETSLQLILGAMRKLDLVALTKMKMALIAPNRMIGVNLGFGHEGETEMDADWRDLRTADAGTPEHDLSMVLEPLYLLTGTGFEDYENSYDVNPTPPEDATSAIFASEPLTDTAEDWTHIEFGQMVSVERTGDGLRRRIVDLDL